MTLSSEDLLAISQLMDVKLESILESKLESKLQPIRDDIRFLKRQNEKDILPGLQSVEECCIPMRNDIRFLKLQSENEVLPRIQNIEECYLSTYERYKNGIMQIDAMQADIDIMKNVVMKHSDKLKQLA